MSKQMKNNNIESNVKEKGKRHFSIKWTIMSAVSIPMLTVCVVIVLFASMTLRAGLEDESIRSLKGVATGILMSLDYYDGNYQLKGEDLYKGNHNVSKNMELIDYYAKTNGVEITIFYDNIRRATTLKNDSGQRIVGTAADDVVVSKVLDNGEEYKSTNVIVNGESMYAYYSPIRNRADQVIGMVFAGKASEDVSHYITTRSNFIMIIGLAIYVFCLIGDLILVDRKLLKPIAKLSVVAKKMAMGDINQKLERESNDEFGDLTEDFAYMIDNISEHANITQKVAEGDLTLTCTPISEYDTMGISLKKMLRDNNKNLTVIKDAASRMAAGANEVAGASNSLAEGTTEQASAIQEITASIEEIANGARINADDANRANELVQNTKNEAIRGNEQMKHMIEAMQDINDSSENISKIMKVIDDIAFQTNILALNASVEAARAGIHGKGFAVVADEVRNLASKSAEAAKDSAEMIEDSIKKVEIGSKLAVETAAALEEIQEHVENIAALVSAIADASINQATSVNQINAGISQIADVVQTNSATSEECAAASAELLSLAGQLQQSVDKYKLLSKITRKKAHVEEEIDQYDEEEFE